MRARLPRPLLRLGRRTHLTALYARKKRTSQTRLAGIVFPMDGAQIEELVAQRASLAILILDCLQSKRQFAQLRGLRPTAVFLIACQFDISKEAAPAACTLFEAGDKLIGKDTTEITELIGLH
jgi:hypothetical protein